MGGKIRAGELEFVQANNFDVVQVFEQWAESNCIAKRFDLKFLKDCTIGIDALHYLKNLPQESLLSALGGSPLTLESTITRATNELQKAGLKLHFVFNGLDSSGGDDAAASAATAARLSSEAFNLYEGKQPADAERSFGSSGLSVLHLPNSNSHLTHSRHFGFRGSRRDPEENAVRKQYRFHRCTLQRTGSGGYFPCSLARSADLL